MITSTKKNMKFKNSEIIEVFRHCNDNEYSFCLEKWLKSKKTIKLSEADFVKLEKKVKNLMNKFKAFMKENSRKYESVQRKHGVWLANEFPFEFNESLESGCK